MLGRQDLEKSACKDCDGAGRSVRNRKRPCPTCDGRGWIWLCMNCGGVYGVDCVDTVMDQSSCEKEKP